MLDLVSATLPPHRRLTSAVHQHPPLAAGDDRRANSHHTVVGAILS